MHFIYHRIDLFIQLTYFTFEALLLPPELFYLKVGFGAELVKLLWEIVEHLFHLGEQRSLLNFAIQFVSHRADPFMHLILRYESFQVFLYEVLLFDYYFQFASLDLLSRVLLKVVQ